MKFDFQFGRKRPDRNQIILISVVLTALVASLSQCTRVPQDRLWDLLDEVQRTLFPGTIINDVLLKDPNVIKRRVERDVDKAIRDYERLTGDVGTPKIPLPRLIEGAIDNSKCYTEECKKLGGEIRICSLWLDDCPKD